MSGTEGSYFLCHDIQAASYLGFSFVRPKIGVVSGELVPDHIWTEAIERSLDLAHDKNIVISPEIDSPTPIKHPVVDEYIDFILRTGTKSFGLMIETRIFQDRPLPLCPGETGESGPPFLDGIDVDPIEIIDSTVLIQAKFHEIDNSLVDQNKPRAPVVSALKSGGYTGYLPSAYEGVAQPWRASKQLRRQRGLNSQLESNETESRPAWFAAAGTDPATLERLPATRRCETACLVLSANIAIL